MEATPTPEETTMSTTTTPTTQAASYAGVGTWYTVTEGAGGYLLRCASGPAYSLVGTYPTFTAACEAAAEAVTTEMADEGCDPTDAVYQVAALDGTPLGDWVNLATALATALDLHTSSGNCTWVRSDWDEDEPVAKFGI